MEYIFSAVYEDKEQSTPEPYWLFFSISLCFTCYWSVLILAENMLIIRFSVYKGDESVGKLIVINPLQVFPVVALKTL